MNKINHTFDMALDSTGGVENLTRASYFATAEEVAKDDGNFDCAGTFGCAGSFGGTLGSVGTFGCCC